MSKPLHSKNEILRSNTGLTINPSKAYSRSETRDKLTGLTIIQGAKSSNQEQVSIQGHRYTKTRGAYAHCLLYASSAFRPGQASGIRSESTVISIQSIQKKHQCSDLPEMVIVSAIQVNCQGPDFPAMGIAIDVRRQGCDLPAKCSLIQVNQQDSDLPSKVIAIHVKRPGSDLPTIFTAIRVKRQGPDRPSMVIAIRVKRQEPDPPSMVIAIDIRRQGSDLPAMCSIIQVNQQDSDLPSMVIVLNPPRSCFTDPDSVRGYRPNSKDQNSNLGYSSNIKDLISNQGYGYTLFSLSLHAFFRIGLVCLRSGYTMKILFSFQCDRYIHLVRPLVTVGFISLLSSQFKPAIMDPISVQCYSVLAVKVPLLSMPMIPNPSPIQSDRATIKDPISIQYDSVFTAQVEEQGFLLHPRLQPRPIDPGLLSSRVTTEANDQSFDILLGSQQAFNAQLYIKGRRYTRIFKQFTKN
ncbi:hypothetical protein F4703DRAFT_1794319 [Phycomyces blakesleeanus]